MSGPGATPIFVDTSALYAHFDADDANHDRARAVFDAIRSDTLTYRPLYVTSHVLAELGTLLVQQFSSDVAADRLTRIQQSPRVNILYPDADPVNAAVAALRKYDDQVITLVDHLTGILASERDVEHIFAFDSDFQTLGFTLVPEDVEGP